MCQHRHRWSELVSSLHVLHPLLRVLIHTSQGVLFRQPNTPELSHLPFYFQRWLRPSHPVDKFFSFLVTGTRLSSPSKRPTSLGSHPRVGHSIALYLHDSLRRAVPIGTHSLTKPVTRNITNEFFQPSRHRAPFKYMKQCT